jgi:magnesium-transporting ATPase (P-type)
MLSTTGSDGNTLTEIMLTVMTPVVMITGDHLVTATTIARELTLLGPNDIAFAPSLKNLSGTRLRKIGFCKRALTKTSRSIFRLVDSNI